MALRYLDQSQESQYVPTYTPIDPQLLSQSHRAIEQQGARGRQYRREVFDVARDNIASSVSNLGQRDAQYAQERLVQSQQRLREISQREGDRNLMPFVDEEVQSVTQDLAPLQRASELKATALKKIEENDQAPAQAKQFIRQQAGGISGEYDEEGNLVGVSGNINQKDLDTVANWEDPTSDIQSYISNMSPDVREGGFYPDTMAGTATPSGTMSRGQVEELGIDKIQGSVANFLLSNPQYREQMELEGKIELQNVNDQYDQINQQRLRAGKKAVPKPLKVNEKGEVIMTRDKVVRDTNGDPVKDDEGNIKTKTVTEKVGNSLAQYKALDRAESFTGQGYRQMKYTDTRKLPGFGEEDKKDDKAKINNRWIRTREELPREQETLPSYMNNLYQNTEKLNNQYNSVVTEVSKLVPGIFGKEDVEIVFEEGTQNIQIDAGSGLATLDEIGQNLDDYGITPTQYGNLQDYQSTLKNIKSRSDVKNMEIDQAKDGIRTKIAQIGGLDPDFVLDHMEVNDQGGIDFVNTSQMEEVPKAIKGSGIYQPNFPSGRNPELNTFRQSDKQSAVLNLQAEDYPDPSMASPERQPVYVEKNNDGSLSYHRVDNSLQNKIENIQSDVMNTVTGQQRRDTFAYLIPSGDNEQGDLIRETLKDNFNMTTAQGSGQFYSAEDPSDEIAYDLDENTTFNSSKIFVGADGKGRVKGTIIDENNSPIESVIWAGDGADSAVKQALGPEYQKIISDRAIENVLPNVYDTGEVNLTKSDLASLTAFVKNDRGVPQMLDDLRINTHKMSVGGQKSVRYTIESNDGLGPDKHIIATDKGDLVNKIRQMTIDKFSK